MQSGRTHLDNDVSGALLGERLVGLFDDIDISGLGVRDSFYGFWELGHGWWVVGAQEREVSRLGT